jgi:hypothetical protein
LSLQVSISEAMQAQFAPPSSLPAKSEFFLDRITVSDALRPLFNGMGKSADLA